MAPSLSDARNELVRERVLAGVFGLLERGEALTFVNVARAAGVPERTCYRHFPTREALLKAVFDGVNRRLGLGERPRDAEELKRLVRKLFSGFDDMAPVVRELLSSPEGRLARLAANPARQRAAMALVEQEAPGLEESTARRVAAVLQLLGAAATWQVFRDYWHMDGGEAAEASALAIELIVSGAKAKAATSAHANASAKAKRHAAAPARRKATAEPARAKPQPNAKAEPARAKASAESARARWNRDGAAETTRRDSNTKERRRTRSHGKEARA